MTGEMIRDLLEPLIGKNGSVSMLVSQAGHVGFIATGSKKLTGVEVRPDGLVRLQREAGWAVIDRWESSPSSGTANQSPPRGSSCKRGPYLAGRPGGMVALHGSVLAGQEKLVPCKRRDGA